MKSVKDLMTKEVITIDMRKTVFDAAVLMNEKRKGCLVVTKTTQVTYDEVPIGIVTERDFVRRVVAIKLPMETEISEIMSKPLITIDPDSSIREAARLMLTNKIRRLPVTKENKLVGIIVISDFARQLSKKTITEEILEAMSRYPPVLSPYEL